MVKRMNESKRLRNVWKGYGWDFGDLERLRNKVKAMKERVIKVEGCLEKLWKGL